MSTIKHDEREEQNAIKRRQEEKENERGQAFVNSINDLYRSIVLAQQKFREGE